MADHSHAQVEQTVSLPDAFKDEFAILPPSGGDEDAEIAVVRPSARRCSTRCSRRAARP